MIVYVLVAVSFIVLRRNEPEMVRPFRASGGQALEWFGIVASLCMASIYLPGMPPH